MVLKKGALSDLCFLCVWSEMFLHQLHLVSPWKNCGESFWYCLRCMWMSWTVMNHLLSLLWFVCVSVWASLEGCIREALTCCVFGARLWAAEQKSWRGGATVALTPAETTSPYQPYMGKVCHLPRAVIFELFVESRIALELNFHFAWIAILTCIL